LQRKFKRLTSGLSEIDEFEEILNDSADKNDTIEIEDEDLIYSDNKITTMSNKLNDTEVNVT